MQKRKFVLFSSKPHFPGERRTPYQPKNYSLICITESESISPPSFLKNIDLTAPLFKICILYKTYIVYL